MSGCEVITAQWSGHWQLKLVALGSIPNNLDSFQFSILLFDDIPNLLSQARAIVVPTDDAEVKARLRELKEPICKTLRIPQSLTSGYIQVPTSGYSSSINFKNFQPKFYM